MSATVTAEIAYLFQVMSRMAAAKAANSTDIILDCIDDLDMIATHSGVPCIAERAALEAASAAQLVADLLAEAAPAGAGGVVLTFARAAALAPVN